MDLGNDELAKKSSGTVGEHKKYLDVETWWDSLPGGKRRKISTILGLSNVSGKIFSGIDDSTGSEIKAYFDKHDGMVVSR